LRSQNTFHFDDPQFGTWPEWTLAPSVYKSRATIKSNRTSVCGWSPEDETLETTLACPGNDGQQQAAPNALPPPRWINPHSAHSSSIAPFAIE
jgi:hypothetical protein